MAKKGQVTTDKEELTEEAQKEFVIPKDATVGGEMVTVVSLGADPYHEDGVEFELAKKTADLRVKQGWVALKESKETEE